MIISTLVTVILVGIVFAYLRKPRHINERYQGEHAVVIGGSMGGILAAASLSRHFKRVTILEYGEIPVDREQTRPQVPQGHQPHALYKIITNILDELLPGANNYLEKNGTVKTCFGKDDLFFFQNTFFCNTGRVGIHDGINATRPLLENSLRQYLLDNRKNVTFQQKCRVQSYIVENGAIVGIQYKDKSSGVNEALRCDFVVDCSGRNGGAGKRLARLGYNLPEQTKVKNNACYTTWVVTFPEKPPMGLFYIGQLPPNRPEIGIILRVHNDQYQVLVGGLLGVQAPLEYNEAVEFAREKLPVKEFAELLTTAKPLNSQGIKYIFPESVRFNYDTLPLPKGLVLLGDTLCSLNPVYGQGIAVASREAQLLEKMLCEHDKDAAAAMYYRGVKPVLDSAWEMSASSDLMFPECEGKRNAISQAIVGYVSSLMQTLHHETLRNKFHYIQSMQNSNPLAIFHPLFIGAVILRRLGFIVPTGAKLPNHMAREFEGYFKRNRSS